jgi:hypothetical protein
MKLRTAVFALSALGSLAIASGSATAMPNGIPHADQVAVGQASNVEHVRMVCNAWGHCRWRPNWYGAYGFYGHPRPWHRWHHWRRW